MKKYNYKKFIILILPVILIWSCDSKKTNKNLSADEMEIMRIHADYVNGWLEMNEEKVMGLLEENARIQPNRLKPIEGKPEIRLFWFPNDNSTTVINEYKTELISLNVIDTLATSTHTSLLDWTYKKDTIGFGMLQRGINTTIYRKQTDKSWKIWRSMWTDIYAERK